MQKLTALFVVTSKLFTNAHLDSVLPEDGCAVGMFCSSNLKVKKLLCDDNLCHHSWVALKDS